MEKSQSGEKRSGKADTEELFIRAAKQVEKGKFRSAFQLYLAAAKSGDTSCQVNVGNFYDDGTGVRRNRKVALYWYKRAYRRGVASAASNIGVVWRNEKNPKRAVQWFKKAVRLGDDEANLDIAKYCLEHEHNPVKAIHHLEKVLRSNRVSEAGMEEAAELLKQAKAQSKLR